MILAIDTGNTVMTAGLFSPEGTLYFRGSIKTDKNKTQDQLAIDLLDIFRLYQADIRSVTGVVLSSVVPPMTSALAGAARQLTGREPMIVGPGMKTGMNIIAEIQNQLGADIVASAVAALQRYPAPIIVIDMGTATTMSVVDSSGNYIGGVILPGLKVSLDSLSSKTAQLPYISLDMPGSVIGKNTIDCMRSGIMYGNAAMIDGIIDRMEAELGMKASVVATGGLARFITPLCRHHISYEDDLLLKGLLILYDKNCRTA